ncbi:MAG: hypothetical protein ACRDHN_07620 [Thermomicrobiales bacterium]
MSAFSHVPGGVRCGGDRSRVELAAFPGDDDGVGAGGDMEFAQDGADENASDKEDAIANGFETLRRWPKTVIVPT